MRSLPAPIDSHPLHGTWGFLETSVARYGEMRARLVILPPDTSDLERLRWTVLRYWPFVGLLVGASTGLLTAEILGAGPALAVAVSVWLVPVGALWAVTRSFAHRIHEEWVTCEIGCEDSDAHRQDLRRTALTLAAAEEAWHSGRGSRGAFDDAWSREWERHQPLIAA